MHEEAAAGGGMSLCHRLQVIAICIRGGNERATALSCDSKASVWSLTVIMGALPQPLNRAEEMQAVSDVYAMRSSWLMAYMGWSLLTQQFSDLQTGRGAVGGACPPAQGMAVEVAMPP